jgi:uncharacterized membrane protein
MFGPATVAGHPAHAILIAFPVALFSTCFLLDVIYFIRGRDPFWARCSFVVMVIGVLGTIVAALAGIEDYLSYQLHADPTAVTHLKTGLTIATLYIIQVGLRWKKQESLPTWMLGLSLISLAALGYQGWLGGELVYVQHVAVASQAEPPSARNSKDDHPAGPALPAAQVAEAVKIFNDQSCIGCHRLPSGGGAVGPDLSHEGTKRDAAWLDIQIKSPATHTPNSRMPAFGDDTIPAAKRQLLAKYLASLK